MQGNLSTLVTIVMYGFIIAMLVNIVLASKEQKKGKELASCVSYVKDKEVFFQKINALLEENANSPLYLNKTRVVKLWGLSYHREYDQFEELLDSIDLNTLIKIKKNLPNIELTEDSFFYMYLGIPNILYRDDRADLRKKMIEKMQPVDDQLKGQLVREISLEINKYYENKDDSELPFYEKILSGDYAEYKYSKSLIGLYKSIINAQAARIYLDRGDNDKYQECMEMLKDFNRSGVGQRWLESLHMDLPKPETAEAETETETTSEDKENDQETFNITEESAKNPDVIDAEVVNEEEKKEDQK